MSLTAKELRRWVIYDPDTGIIRWRERSELPRPHRNAGKASGRLSKGQLVLTLHTRKHLCHRLAWLYMTGEWPKNQIDHINRDPIDNRWCNLREATGSENQCNRGLQSNNRSGVTGVYFSVRTGKWCAAIKVRRKRHWLGTYATKDDAVTARQKAVPTFHGAFAP